MLLLPHSVLPNYTQIIFPSHFEDDLLITAIHCYYSSNEVIVSLSRNCSRLPVNQDTTSCKRLCSGNGEATKE